MPSDFSKLMDLAKKLARIILLRGRIDEVDTSGVLNREEREYIMERLSEPGHWLERSRVKKDVDASHTTEWEKLKANTVNDTRLRYLKVAIKVAAVFIGVVGCAYFFLLRDYTNDNGRSILRQESITLDLGNGTVEKLVRSEDKQFKNGAGEIVGRQNADQLDYTYAGERSNSVDEANVPLVYHKLTVPYGKTFQLVLSDGTQVHLNSGTSLTYPVKFINGKNREVFMEGEAFFNVHKNKEQPFVVNANDLGIQVLGTQFVVSSYPEDEHINTVLLEGSVGLYQNSRKSSLEKFTMLEPGFMGSWDKREENISVKEVDTNIHTAWTKGRLVFSHMKFNDIIKKLGRCYNVSIENNNTGLGGQTFTATFDIKIETIGDILESFNKNYGFDYEIEADEIVIY